MTFGRKCARNVPTKMVKMERVSHVVLTETVTSSAALVFLFFFLTEVTHTTTVCSKVSYYQPLINANHRESSKVENKPLAGACSVYSQENIGC